MKNTTIIVMFITAILGSCGDSSTPRDTSSTAAIRVETTVISNSENTPFISASGTVEAVNSASLSTRMMGFVERIPVKTGDRVRKGSLLLSINNSDLSAKQAQANAAITEARAALTNAEKDYNRFKALFEDSSASQKELDDMRARYEMAKARYDASTEMKNEVNAQFTYTNLRAPFDGVVTGIFTDEGDMANPGIPLVTLEAPGIFEVNSRIAESYINEIDRGKVVSVVLKAIDTTVSARITEVSSSSTKTGGQFLVKAILDKNPSNLRSGMYATVLIPVDRASAEASIRIPASAIVERGQLKGVYTVSQQQTAILRWIRTGEEFGDRVEVISGLSEGESVIINAEGKLYNGVNVTVQ